nr:pentatricopeptide repeat-containing protein [Tanacetum cinerariifolium]
MEWVTKQARLILPYGMLLTRLFDFIIDENPELQNESYVLYDRVMNPLAAQLERKPRRDRGTTRGRHSTSSSALNQPSLSHLNDDDDDDGNNKGNSRASTPSPIRDEDVTITPSPTTTSSSLTPPNVPSKTTSTKQTSSSQENTSSSFQSKLQISPPSSNEPISPHPLNPLLDNILDTPPRPLNSQPLQSHPFLDITLSLSPITPLDHIHDTPSPPSPPKPQPSIIGFGVMSLVLQSISCSPECKIVGQLLLDHPLSYALTATADVLAMVGYRGVVDKEYEAVFQKVDIPMKQPQLVVSTQGTNRGTPRALRSPTVSAKEEKDDDDFEDRLEPMSHKENPEVDDDDDNAKKKVEEKKDDEMGGLEFRTEETQTTIPTPPSSFRKILSLDNKIDQELTDNVANPTTTTSKHSQSKRQISSSYSHISVEQALKEAIQEIAENATNDLIEYNLKPCIAATIIEDRDAFRSEIPTFVS